LHWIRDQSSTMILNYFYDIICILLQLGYLWNVLSSSSQFFHNLSLFYSILIYFYLYLIFFLRQVNFTICILSQMFNPFFFNYSNIFMSLIVFFLIWLSNKAMEDSESQDKLFWTKEMLHTFHDICIKVIKMGMGPNTYFNTDGWRFVMIVFK
jgi:hypothetical protein